MNSLQRAPDIQDIQHQIQLRGGFCPLQWLMDCGLLDYGNYEQWRYGELATLEQALACEREELWALLQQAQRLAQQLKLTGEPQRYHDWRPEQAQRELHYSLDSDLGQLLSLRWRRPQDIPQLDLFMDSGAASAENELVDCLGDRHWAQAELAYGQLCEVAPNHDALGGYETLVLYGKHIANSKCFDPAALADELAGLEEDIAPLAGDLLGRRARDYLAPAWRRLASSLPLTNPAYPRHASYAWAKIPDWSRLVASIEATPDYEESAELLLGLAQGLYASGQLEPALLLAARMSELDPERAPAHVKTVAIPPLQRHWQSFEDSDDPHPVTHFSVWLLLCHPGLIHHLDSGYPLPTSATFQAATELLQCRAEGRDQIRAREALQAISPGLLRVYLSTV